jgi:N-glycosylase/DNA lyase
MTIEINERYFDPHLIADSGQCFRWYELKDGSVAFSFESFAAIIHSMGSGKIKVNVCDCLNKRKTDDKEIKDKIITYFDLHTDYEIIIESIDSSDKVLSAAASMGSGIRILNQDTWETILSFMISQNNNIPRIKKSIDKICKRFGERIDVDKIKEEYGLDCDWPDELSHTFPGPFDIDPEKLDDLGLGYREEYIRELVYKAREEDFFLHTLDSLDGIYTDSLQYKKVHEGLLSIKGIGNKVASCIELFGLHCLDAFPVDTWVKKIEGKYYDGNFPKDRYRGYAGVMQQYLFYYERQQ